MYLSWSRKGWYTTSRSRAFCHARYFHKMELRCTWPFGSSESRDLEGIDLPFMKGRVTKVWPPCWLRESCSAWKLARDALWTTWTGARGGPAVHTFTRPQVILRHWKRRNTMQRLKLYPECQASQTPTLTNGCLSAKSHKQDRLLL